MNRVVVLLMLASCRSTTVASDPPTAAQSRVPAAVVPPTPIEITDVTTTERAACARHREVYRCWGEHPAFAALLGAPAGSGGAIDTPRVIDGSGALRRLVLTGSGAWGVDDRGTLVAWTKHASSPYEPVRWMPDLGTDVRDVAATWKRLCLRRGSDIDCWKIAGTASYEDMLEQIPRRVTTDGGGAMPDGVLVVVGEEIVLEAGGKCHDVDVTGRARPPTDGPCGVLDAPQAVDASLPPDVDARTRGECLLVEGVRLLCPSSLRAGPGVGWDRQARVIAWDGVRGIPEGCRTSGAAIECGNESVELPIGIPTEMIGSSDDEAHVVGSDGSVYAFDREELQLIGRAKPPLQIVPLGEGTCIIDGARTVKCQEGVEPYVAVRGIPQARSIQATNRGWVVEDAAGTLWEIDAIETGAKSPKIRKRGKGQLAVALGDSFVARDGDSMWLRVHGNASPQALGDDPLGRFVAKPWAQLVYERGLLCGRAAAGTVECLRHGHAPSSLPVEGGTEGTSIAIVLPFAATDLFVAGQQLCAASKDRELACWGSRPDAEEVRWIDVTDRVLAAVASPR